MISKRRTCLAVWLMFASTMQALGAAAPAIQVVSVNAAAVTGKIKRLNDLDGGPLCQRGIVDLTKYYKDLGVRNTRLHDVPWSYDNVIDINYVFPHWDADPDRPESYDFTQTDFYLKTITDLGINIIYRLGYSAEYKTAIYHRAPPPSYDKWADVAAHIVSHYNDGWASGQHAAIKYWEVWNEPDTDVAWTGTAVQYYELYRVTAKRLKTLDPTLKVGGPVSGSLTYIDAFLKYQKERQVPVDFVSWHSYKQDPADPPRFASNVHDLMIRDGYPQAESILDEWNYGPSDWLAIFAKPEAGKSYFHAIQDSVGAAYDSAVMIGLQDAPIDIATFYSGTTFMWGLFTQSGAAQKPYYAFLAFSRLLDSPNRLKVDRDLGTEVKLLAGISDDRQTIRILMSNPSREAQTLQVKLRNLPWKGPAQLKQQVVSDRYDLEEVGGSKILSRSSLNEKIGAESVVLVTIHASTQ